jgi:small subunit ribosomal protein S2
VEHKANDLTYSLRCIQVIAGVLGRAGEAGQRKRLQVAKSGQVTWLPPPGLGRPDAEEERTNKTDGRRKKEVKTRKEDDEKLVESIEKRAKFTSFADEEDL